MASLLLGRKKSYFSKCHNRNRFSELLIEEEETPFFGGSEVPPHRRQMKKRVSFDSPPYDIKTITNKGIEETSAEEVTMRCHIYCCVNNIKLMTTIMSGLTKGIWWSSIKRRPPREPGAQYRVFPSSQHWRWCHPSQAAPGWAGKTNKEAGVCRERKRFIFLFSLLEDKLFYSWPDFCFYRRGARVEQFRRWKDFYTTWQGFLFWFKKNYFKISFRPTDQRNQPIPKRSSKTEFGVERRHSEGRGKMKVEKMLYSLYQNSNYFNF